MARQRTSGRGAPASGDGVGSAALALRTAWIAGAGAIIFTSIALASFDAADPPSHAVAVHNAPIANLCGRAGALIAYWAYHALGIGAWVVLAGLGGALYALSRERTLGHPIVRGVGLLIAAAAVAGMHALLLPTTGSLPGAPAGVLATVLVSELIARFATVGTLLVLIAAFWIGAVVAADRVALAAPLLAWKACVWMRESFRAAPEHFGEQWRWLIGRPGALLATAGGAVRHRQDAPADDEEEAWEEDGYEDGDEDGDEDEYEYEDEYEDDGDDGDDDEYEYEDEEEEEDDDESDAAADEDAEAEATEAAQRLTAEELRQKIAKLPVRMASRQTKVARDEDIPRTESFLKYEFPGLDLLHDPDTNFSTEIEEAVRRQAQSLEESLQTYGIDAEVVGIESGPAVTLYSVQLAPGTKVAKISAISSDIARSLKAQNIRVVPVMKGRTAIGIEVPNEVRERVRLKELMSGGHARGMILPMFLGKDAAGEPLVADLTRMPHMLIAGTTGSGKSVCMNSILMSWLYTKRPDELKLVLVDPKMVEMSQFADIPHLMCPVVTESTRAAAILEWAVERMEERYELLKEARVRDIRSYNELTEEDLYELFEAETDEEKARIPKKLSYMVFVVDELADMMMTCKEVEHSIVRIAQKARAVGIHLILATQRPQANVVTGLIKANMPCRVSFKVSSGMDSRIVLDSKGAELLLGQGDMMMISPHSTELNRAQGTLVEDKEIRTVTKFLKSVAGPTFERSLMSLRASTAEMEGLDATERDPLFEQAVDIIIDSGRGSVSLLQRRLSIGYGRASRLVDQMGLAGILGDHKGSVAREVMITMEDWQRMKAMEDGDGEDEDEDGHLD